MKLDLRVNVFNATPPPPTPIHRKTEQHTKRKFMYSKMFSAVISLVIEVRNWN